MKSYVRSAERRHPAWHAAGLSLGLAFVLLLMLARLHPYELNQFDLLVEPLLLPLQTFTVVSFFLIVSVLGSTIGVTLIALGAAYLLRRNYFTLVQLFLLLLFSSLSMTFAKLFVERARPEALLWLDPLNTYSFPSGHATFAASLYGFLLVCIWRRIHTKSIRVFSAILLVSTIVLVGISRIVLNAHYFSDVIAGTLLGLFWLSVILMLPRPK